MRIAVYVVGLIVVCVLVFVAINGNPLDGKQSETQGLYTEKYIDSVMKSYDNMIKVKTDSIIVSKEKELKYKDSIISIYSKLEDNKEKIKIIKKATNEKITKLASVSTDSLALFFTTRTYSEQY